jgi:GH25 family lysozyme M1 (1,4-beta-N-acetylmuramidase)
MSETCLLIDVWEGQLEMDEAVLKANGVVGMGIRLNDMQGGHHKDAGFNKQWAEAAGFVRFPYFVYNPWVDGATNYAWLANNMPAGAKTVAIDVEVKKSGYLPSVYATELEKFLGLAGMKWKMIIYTAEWFLPNLSRWPKCDYWWAQYPDGTRYFGGVKTWGELRKRLAVTALVKPFNAGACPGPIRMWQVSGDYLVLPGGTRDIDVNVFFGSTAECAAYFGDVGLTEMIGDTPIFTELTLEEKVAKLWAAHPEVW